MFDSSKIENKRWDRAPVEIELVVVDLWTTATFFVRISFTDLMALLVGVGKFFLREVELQLGLFFVWVRSSNKPFDRFTACEAFTADENRFEPNAADSAL